jgi:hypothetical protein
MLVRRINQLYHDLTQDVFDHAHRYRHRVEREFWQDVRLLLNNACNSDSTGRTVVDLACGTGFVTHILAGALRPRDRLDCRGYQHGRPGEHRPQMPASSQLNSPLPTARLCPCRANRWICSRSTPPCTTCPIPGRCLAKSIACSSPADGSPWASSPTKTLQLMDGSKISRGTDRLAWYAVRVRTFGVFACGWDWLIRTRCSLRNDEGISAAINRRSACANRRSPNLWPQRPFWTASIRMPAERMNTPGSTPIELIRAGFQATRSSGWCPAITSARRPGGSHAVRGLADAGLRIVLPASRISVQLHTS